MPAYATTATNSSALNPVPPTVLYPGDDVYVLGTMTAVPGLSQVPNDSNVLPEAVVVGERSIAVGLAPRPGGGSPAGLMVQVVASANPGAAEIDVQDASVDADAFYLTPANAAYKLTSWTQNGTTWVAWTQLQPESGRFTTVKVVANPNAVKFTCKLSYV